MYKFHEIGKMGEDLATKFLQNKKFEIIERNFMCKQGEIDIIAQDKNEIVFIEVKTRTNKNYGEPIDAVTDCKRKHLRKAIEYYIYIKKLQHHFIRVDVVEIFIKENNDKSSYKINHIKQIF